MVWDALDPVKEDDGRFQLLGLHANKDAHNEQRDEMRSCLSSVVFSQILAGHG